MIEIKKECVQLSRNIKLRIYKSENGEAHQGVLIVPAFAHNYRSYEMLASIVAQTHIAACPEPLVGSAPKNLFLFPDVNGLRQESVIKAAQYLHDLTAQPLIGIFHSKGAIDGMPAVLDHPEFFSTVILDAPSGIHPGIGFVPALLNLRRGDKLNGLQKQQIKAQASGESARLIELTNQIADDYRKDAFRKYREVFNTAKVTIDRHFPYLKTKGVKILVVAHKNDVMFPPDYLKPPGIELKGIEKFLVLPGPHGGMLFLPEIAKQVTALLHA